jgi:nitrite reductase/ring-hydroxylating ferredoxin subunit/uncharacterized membrane protein
MATEGITELVNQQTWLDPVSDVLQKLIQDAYAAGGQAGRGVEKALSGTWLGHSLHPVLTDVPIGAWTVALALDAVEVTTGSPAFAPGADAAVSLGVAAALAAAVTGLSDWHYTMDRPRRLGIAHGLLNLGATGLYAASLVMRRAQRTRAWGRRLSYLGYAVAASAAWLGGDLTLGEHLGADHAPDAAPDDFTAVLRDDQLTEGQPQRVVAADIPVMLVRQGGQIHALAETCSHLGGPLSEGTLQDGSIVCPWHASRFALADGRVLDGPATFPQPCYQTRVRDGQIEVGPRCVLSALAPTSIPRVLAPGAATPSASNGVLPRLDNPSRGGE